MILDNLVTGRREFTAGRDFYEGDIADGKLVDRVFTHHPDIDAVIHCAALIVVPDSVANPIRYYRANVFNPIGADPKMRTGLQLPRPTHALGKMMLALEDGVPFQVTGTDYPTRDGSGIRDYIHVWDLASAHFAALRRFDELLAPAGGYGVIDLGTGNGTTVRELLDAFNSVASVPITTRDAGRRPGDVAGAYTRTDRAAKLLDWQPQYDIADGIRHSLQWAAIRDEVLSGAATRS